MVAGSACEHRAPSMQKPPGGGFCARRRRRTGRRPRSGGLLQATTGAARRKGSLMFPVTALFMPTIVSFGCLGAGATAYSAAAKANLKSQGQHSISEWVTKTAPGKGPLISIPHRQGRVPRLASKGKPVASRKAPARLHPVAVDQCAGDGRGCQPRATSSSWADARGSPHVIESVGDTSSGCFWVLLLKDGGDRVRRWAAGQADLGPRRTPLRGRARRPATVDPFPGPRRCPACPSSKKW